MLVMSFHRKPDKIGREGLNKSQTEPKVAIRRIFKRLFIRPRFLMSEAIDLLKASLLVPF